MCIKPLSQWRIMPGWKQLVHVHLSGWIYRTELPDKYVRAVLVFLSYVMAAIGRSANSSLLRKSIYVHGLSSYRVCNEIWTLQCCDHMTYLPPTHFFKCVCVCGGGALLRPLCYRRCMTVSDIDECSSLPCQHGGTCVSGTNSHSCRCPSTYRGTNCQIGKSGT